MKKWVISISQNGWEYTGSVTFYAKHVKKISDKILLVDGREMEFDEEIREPEIIKET